MFCRNCGKEMRDDARFCPNCGAVSGGEGAPGVTPWEAPAGGGRKRRGAGLLIGAGVAVVAVIALLTVVVSGLFASPGGAVEKALAKTAAAYQAADKKMGLPDLDKLQEERSVSQRFSLELNRINSDLIGYDLSAFSGMGLRVNADYDGKARKIDADLAAYWGDEDLLSVQMLFDDSELYFGSPQFLGSDFFGMNTETLGADLAELTGDDSAKDLSFNIFDLMDILIPEGQTGEMEKQIKESNKALFDAAKIKKTGAKTMDINGTDTKTTAYHVTVPQDALEDYVDAMEQVMSSVNYVDMYEELFQAMGMPKDEIEDILSGLEELDTYGELADLLKGALEELGDLELDVYLSDGYVSAVIYEGRVQGTQMEIGLYLGGGEEYVDDLSLIIKADNDTIEVKSTGDHGLKSGSFTDKTTIRVREGGNSLARITSEMSYAPKESGNNLQWDVEVNSSGINLVVLEMEGRLEAEEDSVDLRLEDVSVRVMSMEVCSLGFRYYMGPCREMTVSVNSSRMLADMDEFDLMEMAYDIQENAEDWAADMQNLFMDRLPQELLWALMYGF